MDRERMKGTLLLSAYKIAISNTGLEPLSRPVRGGTDGARLSFMGLPCPNLGTGGYGFHGPYEHISVEGMETAIQIIRNIVTIVGEQIELSYKEFELLTYFAENQGLALSREKILNNVWNYDYFGDARTIDTHVKKLRSKLGEKGGKYIKTIWGMGYKLEV